MTVSLNKQYKQSLGDGDSVIPRVQYCIQNILFSMKICKYKGTRNYGPFTDGKKELDRKHF